MMRNLESNVLYITSREMLPLFSMKTVFWSIFRHFILVMKQGDENKNSLDILPPPSPSTIFHLTQQGLKYPYITKKASYFYKYVQPMTGLAIIYSLHHWIYELRIHHYLDRYSSLEILSSEGTFVSRIISQITPGFNLANCLLVAKAYVRYPICLL